MKFTGKKETVPKHPKLRNKKKSPFISIILLLLIAPFLGHAQEILVKGRITNEAGDPVPKASVTVKQTARGVSTTDDGSFEIKAPSNGTLVVSSVGFVTREIKINNQASVSLSLVSLNNELVQVVVVGYGTQKRALVTGAVSSVSGKTLNEVPVVSISQALQGRVRVCRLPIMAVRAQTLLCASGVSALSAMLLILYILLMDFPPVTLSAIDTKDIESVDVLKDASAAAIYGSRATNGVIMITTKKGRRDGKMHVSLDSYYGTQTITKRLDLLNTEQFKQYAIAYRGSQVPRLLAALCGSAGEHRCNTNLWPNQYQLAGCIF